MKEEPDMVGFTIHRVTDMVDAGPVIHQEKVPVYTGDRYENIFSRCTMHGAIRTGEICDLIQSADNHITTVAQDLTIGTEYRGVPNEAQWDELHARACRASDGKNGL